MSWAEAVWSAAGAEFQDLSWTQGTQLAVRLGVAGALGALIGGHKEIRPPG